jgi:putative transposase
MGDNYKTSLIEAAIEMATRNHELADGAIFHADRGSHYTPAQFATTLKNNNLRQSVGRTRICYDNAMAESFFGTLKNERTHRTEYPPANTHDAILPATSNCATILDVAIRDSSSEPTASQR